jgi:hypothetical protein
MTLREFLAMNAPADDVRRRKTREEWIAAVDRLLKQMREWVTDADASRVLELEPLQFDKREQGLGAYRIAGLGINFGERSVQGDAGRPDGSRPPRSIRRSRTPECGRARGHYQRLPQILSVSQADRQREEQWLAQREGSGLQPLNRERFEAILQELLA